MSIKEGNQFELPVSRHKRQRISEFGSENHSFNKNNHLRLKPENPSFNKYHSESLANSNFISNNQDSMMIQDYFILEKEGAVDSVTIHYADIVSLKLRGILSLDNYSHLYMIPQSLLSKASYVVQVFKTIILNMKKIHISECIREFGRATHFNLDDLFVNVDRELPEFFTLRSDIFDLHPDGMISLMNSTEERSNNSVPSLLHRTRTSKSVAKKQKAEIIIID